MKGLVKVFADNNVSRLLGDGTGHFPFVITTKALKFDLKACPNGKFLPGPFFLGPVDLGEERVTFLTAITPLATLKDGDEEITLEKGKIHKCRDHVVIVSGILKATVATLVPVHDTWKACLSTGKFKGLPDMVQTPLKYDKDQFSLPTKEEIENFFSQIISQPQVMGDLSEEYDRLCTEAAAIDTLIWSKAAFYSKKDAATKKKGLFENPNRKDKDLDKKTFEEALKNFREAVKLAKTMEAEFHKNRDELADLVRRYYEILEGDNDFMSDGILRGSQKGIEKHLKELEVDRTTCRLGVYKTPLSIAQQSKTIAKFIKNVENFRNKPKWKSDKREPSKAISFVKANETYMTKIGPLLQAANKGEVAEKINELLREARATANKNEKVDVGELVHLLSALKKEYKDDAPASATEKKPKKTGGKCIGPDCEKRTRPIIGKGLCFECLCEDPEWDKRLHHYEYCAQVVLNEARDPAFKKVATKIQRKEFKDGLVALEIEDKDGNMITVPEDHGPGEKVDDHLKFKDIHGNDVFMEDEEDPFEDATPVPWKPSIRGIFDNAYEAFEKKKDGCYQKMCDALDTAEAFFATLSIPDEVEKSEDSSDEEEEEEEGSSAPMESESSSGEEEEEDEEEVEYRRSKDKKRARDAENSSVPDDLLVTTLKAAKMGDDKDRQELLGLASSGKTKKLQIKAQEVITANTVHYKIVMLHSDGITANDYLQAGISVFGPPISLSRGDAEAKAKSIIDQLAEGDIEATYKIVEIRPH